MDASFLVHGTKEQTISCDERIRHLWECLSAENCILYLTELNALIGILSEWVQSVIVNEYYLVLSVVLNTIISSDAIIYSLYCYTWKSSNNHRYLTLRQYSREDARFDAVMCIPVSVTVNISDFGWMPAIFYSFHRFNCKSSFIVDPFHIINFPFPTMEAAIVPTNVSESLKTFSWHLTFRQWSSIWSSPQ